MKCPECCSWGTYGMLSVLYIEILTRNRLPSLPKVGGNSFFWYLFLPLRALHPQEILQICLSVSPFLSFSSLVFVCNCPSPFLSMILTGGRTRRAQLSLTAHQSVCLCHPFPICLSSIFYPTLSFSSCPASLLPHTLQGCLFMDVLACCL